MKKLEQIFEYLIDKNKFSLEQRIFNMIINIVIITLLFTAVENHILKLAKITVFIPAFVALILMYVAYISIIGKRYNLSSGLFYSIMSFVLLPLMFFNNGGIYGAVPYFFILFSGVVALIFSGRKKAVLVTIYIIMVTVVFTLGFRYPAMVTEYSTEISRFSDITFAVYLSMILNIALYTLGTRNYKYEQNRAEKLNRLLFEEKEKLRRLSIIDGLTNIYNHRFIVGYLEDEIRKCSAENKVLTAIFLDIDNFKTINDTYGHLFGDLVLKRISETISANLRDTDLAGRYGGEEFLIVLPSKNLEEGYRIAERLRSAISIMEWEQNATITISGGVAELNGHNIHELLEKADSLLYKAKMNGRDRIEK